MSRLLPLLSDALHDLLRLPGVRPRLRRLLLDLAAELDSAPGATADAAADAAEDGLPLPVSEAEQDEPPTPPEDAAALALPTAESAVDEVAPALLEPTGDEWDDVEAPAQGGGYSLAELLGHETPDYAPVAVIEAEQKESPQISLRDLAPRLDLKARAARFLISPVRQKQDHEGLLREGVQLCTRLWMLRDDGVSTQPEVWQRLGACFEAAAFTARLLAEAEERGDAALLRTAMPDAACVASALRVAADEAAGSSELLEDTEQKTLFLWLRYLCTREQIYVERHMRRDDPFSPAGIGGPGGRLTSLLGRYERDEGRKQVLGRVAYHLKRWRQNAFPLTAQRERDDLVRAVEEGVEQGLPSSDRELRELLMPYYDDLPRPEMLSAAYQRVLDHLDAAATRVEAAMPDSGILDLDLPEAVAQAATLLEGSVLLLVGGVPRPEARDALRNALRLEEVRWLETRPHEPLARLRNHVADPRVRCVALLIRFSSHSYGDLITDCEQHGKPLVRLPGGYSPNIVAHHIVEQAARRLGSWQQGLA